MDFLISLLHLSHFKYPTSFISILCLYDQYDLEICRNHEHILISHMSCQSCLIEKNMPIHLPINVTNNIYECSV